jgi:hypothetical protein
MLKSELIKALQAIPGDPDVALDDWAEGHFGWWSEFEVIAVGKDSAAMGTAYREYVNAHAPFVSLGRP